jgi:hypothetical protein
MFGDADGRAMQRNVLGPCLPDDRCNLSELPDHDDHHEDESGGDNANGGQGLF